MGIFGHNFFLCPLIETLIDKKLSVLLRDNVKKHVNNSLFLCFLGLIACLFIYNISNIKKGVKKAMSNSVILFVLEYMHYLLLLSMHTFPVVLLYFIFNFHCNYSSYDWNHINIRISYQCLFIHESIFNNCAERSKHSLKWFFCHY